MGDLPGHDFRGNQWTSHFYLTDYQERWVREGLVAVEHIPVEDLKEWEYGKQGGISEQNATVLAMRKEWEGGFRLPMVEVHKTADGKYKIDDGQHRVKAWAARGHKTMPVLVTKRVG